MSRRRQVLTVCKHGRVQKLPSATVNIIDVLEFPGNFEQSVPGPRPTSPVHKLRALAPPRDAEFLDPHQPWDASQFWEANMHRDIQWEGLVVPTAVIRHRYIIDWMNELGSGTFGRVLEVLSKALQSS